ncbi:TPA: hypothetical protein N2N45_004325 [Klebsiella aerogenes]|nr:hypothetical protein [Klebsiella aerogenes]
MFFKKQLSEKEIYKIALPIVRLQGELNNSLCVLRKYSDVNTEGLIALHLTLLHFISYCIHGAESQTITSAGIDKAIQQSHNSKEIIKMAHVIGQKGPDYIDNLIRKPWGENNENPLLIILSIEEKIKETLNSGYMYNRTTPITIADAGNSMDILKQLWKVEDNFRSYAKELVNKVEKLKKQ